MFHYSDLFLAEARPSKKENELQTPRSLKLKKYQIPKTQDHGENVNRFFLKSERGKSRESLNHNKDNKSRFLYHGKHKTVSRPDQKSTQNYSKKMTISRVNNEQSLMRYPRVYTKN